MDYYEKYLASALHFLGYRSRSEKEVRDNLLKKLNRFKVSEETKKEQEEAVEKVISFLKEQRFLNDAEFVRQWIESRMRSKQRSTWVILRELKEKGIAQDLIEKVLSSDDAPEINDLEQAKILVKKRIRKYEDLPRKEIYQKLGTYLASKGFNWDIVKRSIDDVLDTEYNKEEQ